MQQKSKNQITFQVMRIGGKITNNVILRFFFSKNKIFQKFIKPTKIFFGQNKKICVL
jgi:hypothetical protein